MLIVCECGEREGGGSVKVARQAKLKKKLSVCKL